MAIARFERPEAATAGLLGRSDDAGDQGVLHRYGLRSRQHGDAVSMAATAISATMAWNSSCATAASTRPMKAPTACRRWTWSAASWAARAARRRWRCFGLVSGWLGENEGDEKLKPFTAPVKRGLDTLQTGDDVAGAARHGQPQRCRRRRGGLSAHDGHRRRSAGCGRAWPSSRMAKLAAAKATRRSTKASWSARKYWMERMIPECPMLLERIQAGSETIMEFG